MEDIAAAFFRTMGEKFGIFNEVKRENVNASDASSGMLADIECYKVRKIVLLAEVKDRTLTLTEFRARVEIARANRGMSAFA